jgi:hypothetical protein
MNAKQLSFIDPVPSSAPPHGLREQPHKAEQKRRSANTLRVLDRLKRGPATNAELIEIGGFNAVRSRIPELREDGWIVEAECVNKGLYRYTLKGMK